MSPGDPLLEPNVTTIDDVLERLEDIQTHIEGEHGERDGVARFNFLYHLITQQVRDGANQARFADNDFMRALDVAFANRYFDALRADARNPGSAPKVWQALIDERANQHVFAMQFAVAGVNAHINFDLAFALVNACTTMHVELGAGRQHDTYQEINDVFAEQMEPLRKHYENPLVRFFDRSILSRIANLGGDLAVIVTRDAAWMNGTWMWPRRGDADEIREHSDEMDDAATSLSDVILVHP
jgi:hypothetical protein